MGSLLLSCTIAIIAEGDKIINIFENGVNESSAEQKSGQWEPGLWPGHENNQVNESWAGQ